MDLQVGTADRSRKGRRNKHIVVITAKVVSDAHTAGVGAEFSASDWDRRREGKVLLASREPIGGDTKDPFTHASATW